MNSWQKAIASLVVILALPAFAWGCFQIDQHPIKYRGDQFKVNFSYEGNALSGAFISLTNKQTKNVSWARVDKQGWASFKNLPSGKYKLVMNGPSYELFDVEFTRTAANIGSVFIRFYADYCHSISFRPELSF